MSSLFTSWIFLRQAKHGKSSDDQSIEQEDLLPAATTTDSSRTTNESESRSKEEWRHAAAAYHRLRRTFIIVVLLFICVLVVILWPWPPAGPSAVLLEAGEGGIEGTYEQNFIFFLFLLVCPPGSGQLIITKMGMGAQPLNVLTEGLTDNDVFFF